MKRVLYFLIAMSSIMTITSCGNDDSPDVTIEEYIEQNNLNATMTASGLYYVIDEPGSAERPSATSNVLVHYRGFLLDGSQFDSSFDRGQPIDISLQQVIQGWTEGIQLFGRGGKGLLLIPARLGYGSRGSGSIPPNAPIAFEIELIDFSG